MEVVPKQNPDGTWSLFAKCKKHDWFYKGKPPITHGCEECWMTYYFMQGAGSANFAESTELLESAINHLIESDARGEWDFEPSFDMNIEKDGLD